MAWDFRPGQNFVLNMHAAASKDERTLAVLSPAYLESAFCQPEWAAAFAEDPTGEKGKLIPVRVAECEPKGLLKAMIYIDLVGANETTARQQLIDGLKKGRLKPASQPAFPGTGSSNGSSREGPAFPGGLPPVWTVPFPPNPFFTGREGLMKELAGHLESGQNVAVTQPAVVHGLGGVGKTQMASAYAYEHRACYDAVLWVFADSPEALRTNLAGLAKPEALNLPEAQERDVRVQTDAVVMWLRTHSRWLLVLDSVDSPEAAQAMHSLLPTSLAGHVLVTTRLTHWPLAFFLLEVSVLPLPVATEFLLARTKHGITSAGGVEADAERLAEELGCLPLAMEQAAAYIQHRRITFAGYLRRLEELPERILSEKVVGGTDYERSVMETWLITEQSLSPLARTILRLAGLLAPDAIPRELFIENPEVLAEATGVLCKEMGWAEEAACTPADVEDALVSLSDYSLIVLSAKTFLCHRLVQKVQSERISADARQAWTEFAVRLVDAYAPVESHDARTWPVWDVLRPHVEWVIARSDERGVARHAGRLTNLLSLYLYGRAMFDLAEPFMRRTLAIDVKAFGTEHPNIAASLNNLAQLLKATNRLVEAESLMRQALAISERAFGTEHPTVATGLNNLVVLLQATNRLKEAGPLMRRALVIDEKAFGTEHPTVATDLNNLAQLLQVTKRLKEAEPLMRRALAIDEKAFGTEHPTVATDLNNLAALLQATNRLKEAEPLMRRALAIDEKAFGTEHPEVATDLNNLAQLLQDTKRLKEAEPLMQRTLAIDEKAFGTEHPTVARDLNNLAALLQATNRLKEAEPLMRRALAIDEKAFGTEHPTVAISLSNLALLLQATNRPKEAEPLMRRALAIDENAFGTEHPTVAIRLNNLAQLLQATNRLKEAEPLMRRHVVIFRRFREAIGHEHRHWEAGVWNYVKLLQRMGLSREEVLETLTDVLGSREAAEELLRDGEGS